MKTSNAREILASNVEAICRTRYGKVNKTRLGNDAKIGIGGAQRVLLATKAPLGDMELGTIEKVAAWARVEPWRMLAPGMGRKHDELRLSQPELDLVVAFRDMPEEEQREIFDQALNLADRARRHVERVLRDRYFAEKPLVGPATPAKPAKTK